MHGLFPNSKTFYKFGYNIFKLVNLFLEHMIDPLESVNLFVTHKHTSVYYALEVIVHTNKHTKRHLIHVRLVGCITKALELLNASTRGPHQCFNPTFAVNLGHCI